MKYWDRQRQAQAPLAILLTVLGLFRGQIPEFRTAPDPTWTKWPRGSVNINIQEGGERAYYYGIKAVMWTLLTGLYMKVQGLSQAVAEKAATQDQHLWGAAMYIIPILGGVMADRLLGKYRSIMWLSQVYILGGISLVLFQNPGPQEWLLGSVLVDPLLGTKIGLVLLAIGAGGIKPCVNSHLGDQYGEGNWHLIDKAYNLFYWMINLGSAFVTVAIPIIRGKLIVDPVTHQFSYSGNLTWALAVPCILMGVANLAFWLGRFKYVHVPPTQPRDLGLLDVTITGSLLLAIGWPVFLRGMTSPIVTALISIVCFSIFLLTFRARQRRKLDTGILAVLLYTLSPRIFFGEQISPSEGRWKRAQHKFGPPVVEGTWGVLRVMRKFLYVSVFWALFEQHQSTWTAQALKMNLKVDLTLPQWICVGCLIGLFYGGALALVLNKTKHQLLAIAGFMVACGVGGLLVGMYYPAFTLMESQIAAANPFMVLGLASYAKYWLVPFIEKYLKIKMHPLHQIILGMVLAAISFMMVTVLQLVIDTSPAGSIHVLWQVPQYLVLTLSEVLVSITVLQFAYTQAPAAFKSTLMSLNLVSHAVGDFWVYFLAGVQRLPPSGFFAVFATLMLLAAYLFHRDSRNYVYVDHVQGEAVGAFSKDIIEVIQEKERVTGQD